MGGFSRSDRLVVGALLVGAVLGWAAGHQPAEPREVLVTADQGTAVGWQAMSGAAGANNTGLGYKAARVTRGVGNTAVGTAAMLAAERGDGNVAVGLHAGRDLDGSRNVLLGADSSAAPGVDDSVALGAGVTATRDGQVTVGGRDLQAGGLILTDASGVAWRITVDHGRLVAHRL